MSCSTVVRIALVAVLSGQCALGADQSRADAGPTIEVSGSGEVVVDPDRATLILAIETQGATSAAAAADNARVSTAVTGALLSAGAARSDVITANYTIQPQWQYVTNAPPKRTGYEARNTLRVSVGQLPVLGKWIDAALGAGAARVENIEFDSSHASSARQEALAQAVANAKADAETLAKAAGGTLGPLQGLSTVPTGGARPFMPEVATLNAPRAPSVETHIEPSPLHISAVVTARWHFEP